MELEEKTLQKEPETIEELETIISKFSEMPAKELPLAYLWKKIEEYRPKKDVSKYEEIYKKFMELKWS